MSFISNAFGGQNGFTPGGGNAQQSAQIQTANTNYNSANTGLNQLASSLQAQAAGAGPNLANQNLQNFTGQNVANQAAMAAGQRGASSNVGMIARGAAQAGAGAQQQAAGQASSNVLSQQLAAQQQLGGVLGTQGGLANQNYGTTQGAINSGNQIGSQEAQANANANSNIFGGLTNAAGGILGGLTGQPKPTGSQMAGSSSLSGSIFAAEGGEIQPLRVKLPSKHSNIPEHLQHIASIRYPKPMAQGGKVPIQVSPGERILNPKAADAVKQGKADPIKASQPVPGKAKVKGDSYANDTVPKEAEAGSIVLPRSVTQHKNAPQAAFDFVSRVKAGHHRPKSKK